MAMSLLLDLWTIFSIVSISQNIQVWSWEALYLYILFNPYDLFDPIINPHHSDILLILHYYENCKEYCPFFIYFIFNNKKIKDISPNFDVKHPFFSIKAVEK